MILNQILALLGAIASRLGFLAQLVQQILNAQQWGQLFLDLQTLLDADTAINRNVQATTREVDIVGSNMLTLQNSVTAGFNAVLAAMPGVNGAGPPVTLPPIPPPAYVPPSATDNAGAVWDYMLMPMFIQAKTWANLAAGRMLNIDEDNQLVVMASNPLIGYVWSDESGVVPIINNSLFSGATLPPAGFTDELSYLVAAYPDATWVEYNPDFYATLDPLDPLNGVQYFFLIPKSQFNLYAGTTPPVPPIAPVWPGLANVSLGAPVAISDGVSVAGPMDGIVVAITSVPNPIGYYAFGSEKSYVRAGAIIFQDDNGEFEQAIPIGLEAEVICPRQMTQASSAILRCPTGVTGTLTPFLSL